MTTIELICVLHAIEADPSIAARGEDQSLNCNIDERHALIQEAVDLAEQVLIDEDGERDIQAEVTLALAGFPVRCIEQDRSGWLIGAIETDKGLITYG
jgi:hypothetical protein